MVKGNVIAEYGKYSFKQKLNRLDQSTVLYSGTIQNAIKCTVTHNVPKDDLEKLLKEGYKYVIITT